MKKYHTYQLYVQGAFMIPVSITLQNFLSYGSQPHTVEFGPYRLICLSGKNGHGKSALLDALTWALWGQARKTTGTSKPDEGLLRLGQTDMAVSLDFIFNGQHYRVRRMFSTKYGKPSTHVDFGTYNPVDNYFSPLTEKTIKKTQDLIDHVLGLDYEAFINSSFLRQGQANEFSKKSPKERKDIIATILGLTHYEKARKAAADTSKDAAQQALQLQKVIEHLEQSCALLPLCQTKLSETERTLTTLQQKEQAMHTELTSLTAQESSLQQDVIQAQKLQKQHDVLTKDLTDQQTSFTQAVQQWKKQHHNLLQAQNPEDLSAEQQKLETMLQILLEQKQTLLGLKEKILAKKSDYQAALTSVDQTFASKIHEQTNLLEKKKQEQAILEQQQETIAKKTQELTVQYQQIESTIEELKNQADPILFINDTTSLKTAYERGKEFYQRWLEQGKWVSQELQNLETKKTLSHDADNPSCPLCEQNLSQARKRFLQKKFTDQESFLTHRLNRLRSLLLDLKKQLEQLHKAVTTSTTIDTLLTQQITLSQEKTLLEKEQHKVQEKYQEARTATQKQADEVTQLQQFHIQEKQNNPHLMVCLQDIKALEQACTTYATLETEYAQCNQKLALVKEQRQLTLHYQEKKKELHDKLGTIHQAAQSLRSLQTALQTLHTELSSLLTKHNELEELMHHKKQLTNSLESMRTAKEAALQEKGGLEKQIKTLEEQARLKTEQTKQKNIHEQEAQQYAVIAQAFGKDGIQALLIEDALPEIEQEANDILSRLTDNQAHIFIESLRDLKKGGVRETMDINISDSNGIRPYEMFSGGEAFRIDFSLRIAISKLLARRAGTSLQTLIIDEGFGSQDEDGLARIMDAIYKVQDDFEKIIIVSHLHAMKEQFPVQFQVEKTPHGSHIKILEQG